MTRSASGGGDFLSQFLILAEESAATGSGASAARGFPGHPGMDYDSTWAGQPLAYEAGYARDGGGQDPLRAAAWQLLSCAHLDCAQDQEAIFALLERANARALALDPLTGRAVSAGAAVTILKAVFDLREADGAPHPMALLGGGGRGQVIEVELNKLAANVAGLAAPDDCAACLRVGERIAVDLLRAQLELAGPERELQFETFDGQMIALRSAGTGPEAGVDVWVDGQPDGFAAWQSRHSPDPDRRLQRSA